MAFAPRSPAKRQLGEHNLNIVVESDAADQGSIAQQHLKASVGLQVGKADELSPRRAARRSLKPRKSILKSFSGGSLAADDYTGDFTNMTGYYAQLDENLTMGRQSMSRRVSFAPNAHVRMFEDKEKEKALALAKAASDPNNALAHGRRASIQNIAQVSNPSFNFPNGHQPKESNHTAPIRMTTTAEADTDSEHDSDDDQHGVQMGHRSSLPAPVPEEDGDSEGEMSMDVTGVYGGVIRRQSTMGADASDMSIATQSDGNEEKTMDFTIAIGGMLPNSPPVHAARNRSSIGYSLPQSPSSRGVRIIPGQPMDGDDEDDMDMEMDETVAFGGIIGDDSIISSEGSPDQDRERTMTFTYGDISQPVRDDTNMGMDMTVAMGGIINLPPASPTTATSSTTMPVRPPAGTPSFARPTLASSQRSREATPKDKRNVFAPSPSPYHSTTPRKSGIDTAKEVAQRLSFGSTTSSGGRKRGLTEDLDRPGSAKKARPANGNVFAAGPVSPAPARTNLSASVPASTVDRPYKSPRKSMGTLANYIGTPQRLAHPPKSPGKSPALRRMMGERVPSGHGEDDDEAEWDNDTPPTISLSDFLEMAGVQFMEGLPTLNKRRSSVARGILGQSYSGDREFALHEYAEAQIQSVFLNMYTWAANKMKDDIQSGQADLRETDHICNLDNPPVIREYLSASDEDKALFEMTFKAFKTNTQLKARERWYDWKTDLMAKVRPDVEELLGGMREDKQRLDAMEEQADEVLPALQARLASLQKEVEREREVVSEVAACDQNELADLRAGIAEQSAQIAGFTSELEDSNAKLDVLGNKLAELEGKKSACVGRISLARSRCDQYTRSDVLRIKEEFDSIQRLHLWKLESARPDAIRMTYDEEVRLIVPRKHGLPVITNARVEKVEKPCAAVAGPSSKKRHPEDVTRGMFAMFEDGVKTLGRSTSSLPAFVQRTGQLWASAQRLRSELGVVTMHFPTSYRLVETPTNGRALILIARIMVKSTKSRVELCFLFDQSSLAGFPGALADVEVEAKTVYGSANPDGMKKAARATVAGIKAEGYVGGLLQACVEALKAH